MINSYKKLCVGIVLLLITVILNMPFPHRYPFGEKILSTIGIPTRISIEKGIGTFHVLAIFLIVFLVAGLYVIAKSLDKYQVRTIISVLFAVSLIPNMLVNIYQTNFATGIYAVSYNSEASTCVFDGKESYAECKLTFGNYQNEEITFEVVFGNDAVHAALLNEQAPYQVYLGPKEWKTVKIKTDLDLTNTKQHINNGRASGIQTIIRLDDKEREL